MNLPLFAIGHRTIVLAFMAVLLSLGIFNFTDMPRREDPQLIIRDALVVTAWPGAPAVKIEELITDPLENIIAQIAEVNEITSKSLTGYSIIQISTDDRINDTDQVWDDVRAKVMAVAPGLPQGSSTPFVNSDFGDVYEIVLALYQTPLDGDDKIQVEYSPRQLELYAERIEEELELIDDITRVDFWGVQPEQIYIEVDSADWAKINLTANQLKKIFQQRNIVEPGGEIDTANARYALNPTGEFSSVRQMQDLIIAKVDGSVPVRLADLPIKIDRRYEEPSKSLIHFSSPGFHSGNVLVLGISMKSGRNVVAMGEKTDEIIERLHNTYLPPDIKLTRVNDLPRQVNTRIQDFRTNLMQGIAIVLALAFFTMGWRPALIMATAVPLSMICAFAVVRHLGIELEQFSVASLIIALGMVVDNAIVVSDNTFRLIKEGVPKQDAVVRGAQDLAIPILTSTLTTVFAFLPMLGIVGNVGEYVSSLPVVVTATLVSSYFVAMLVTPLMCAWLLNPEDDADKDRSESNFLLLYDKAIGWCLDHKLATLGSIGIVFLASLMLIPLIGSQFFPSGDRDQFFIKIWLPEGSPITKTTEIARKLEKKLMELSPVDDGNDVEQRLTNVISFIGTGGPRLMLTQEPEYNYPYFAFLLVNTSDKKYTEGLAKDISSFVSMIPGARITVDQYMLGPPIRNPVAFRISGYDSEILSEQGRNVVKLFKQTPGTVSPYSDWGVKAYEVELKINSDAANLAGVTNADVAVTTKSLLSGTQLTTYREGDHLVPVVLRTTREKRENLNDLSGIFVNGKYGKVPLDSVAEIVTTWSPSVIARRNNLRTVTVGARVEEGVLANSVAADLKQPLQDLMSTLPAGYFLEQGGEHEETIKAQVQVVRAVGIAMVLILLVLIIQYNSFLKPMVILFTVPLAMIGVLLGLFITGWALGFMAMLGILSLIGIVINNAIILIDFIQTRVAEGHDLRNAVVQAGRLRLRPIILTSLTTIGGLLPLSLFGGALWAPMTNSMIFGLIFSTVLTLFIVPTIYALFVEKFNMQPNPN